MLQQQQRGRHGALRQPSTGSRRNPTPTAYQQPGGFPGGKHPLQPPTPFKMFVNWNDCYTHGRDVNNTHTGMTCRHPGPLHNPNATRTNTMGGNMAGLHRMILPSTSGRVPPAPHRPPAPTLTMWQQPLPPTNFALTMALMHPMMPATPYQAINYMGYQFGPSPLQFGPPPPAVMPPGPPPAPPVGMMMLHSRIKAMKTTYELDY
jgi:hypothetical protein